MVQIALKYSKSTYDGKITELRGYLDQLSAHKEKMESLRSQIYDFWYDHNARQVTEVLLEQIRQVENAMQRTNEMLNFYSKTVTIMGGADTAIQTELDNALKILNTVFGAAGSVAGAVGG